MLTTLSPFACVYFLPIYPFTAQPFSLVKVFRSFFPSDPPGFYTCVTYFSHFLSIPSSSHQPWNSFQDPAHCSHLLILKRYFLQQPFPLTLFSFLPFSARTTQVSTLIFKSQYGPYSNEVGTGGSNLHESSGISPIEKHEVLLITLRCFFIPLNFG